MPVIACEFPGNPDAASKPNYMRRHRADANSGELYQHARKMGFRLYVNNNALCDAVVQLGPTTELWELKDKKGDFTPLQKKMREAGWTIRTIRSVDDLLLARSEMTRAAAAAAENQIRRLRHDE